VIPETIIFIYDGQFEDTKTFLSFARKVIEKRIRQSRGECEAA